MQKRSVGFIHATIQSTQPIIEAFRKTDHRIELLHFLDEGLLVTLQKEEQLTHKNMRRLLDLVEKAEDCEVDCIQFTCSAFNHLVESFQPLFKTKIFRSDEAMLDEALEFSRVGIVSSVSQTPPVLSAYLKAKNPEIQIKSLVDTEAYAKLNIGNTEEHDKRILDLMFSLEDEVDAIILSQYSMAHMKERAAGKLSIPIISAPIASAKRCRQYLYELEGTP